MGKVGVWEMRLGGPILRNHLGVTGTLFLTLGMCSDVPVQNESQTHTDRETRPEGGVRGK